MSIRRAALITLFVLITPRIAAAQNDGCSVIDRCHFGARAAEGMLVSGMLAAAGGNPWQGSVSTLGFRTVTFPRLGGQVRGTWTGVDLPAAAGIRFDGASLFGLSGALSMALLDGFSPGPTLGGVGSLDIVADLGAVLLPGDAGFDSGAPFTWSLGARVGILRESFNVPGITASVAYRRMGAVRFDRPAVLERDAGFEWENATAWVVRAVAGKRLAQLTLSAGLGWNASSADVGIAHRAGTGAVTITPVEIDADRMLTFVGVSWTRLILALTAEAGWQFGADAQRLAGAQDPAADGRAFGALSARLTF